jgi:hypothetical protein
MELSSPIIDGDLSRSSGRFPKSSSPVTERGPRLSPHGPAVIKYLRLRLRLPADGEIQREYGDPPPPAYAVEYDVKAEVENGSPFTDFDGIKLPDLPPGLLSKLKDEEASGMRMPDLPNIIRGRNGREAYIVYSTPNHYDVKVAAAAGRKHPKALPNYETVLRDRKGIFFNPNCKRYPCLLQWHAVAYN